MLVIGMYDKINHCFRKNVSEQSSILVCGYYISIDNLAVKYFIFILVKKFRISYKINLLIIYQFDYNKKILKKKMRKN